MLSIYSWVRANPSVWFVHSEQLNKRKLIFTNLVNSYHLDITSGLGMGTGIHFLFSTGILSGLDLWRFCISTTVRVISYVCQSSCAWIALFPWGLQSLFTLIIFPSPLSQIFLSHKWRDLVETSYLAQSALESLIFYILPSYEFLYLVQSTEGGWPRH